MSEKIKVLLTDDHLVVRRDIADVLSFSDQISVVGEAESGKDAVELCGTLHPDIVIMDIKMEQMDGIETTRRIRTAYPNISVIGLSTFPHEAIVRKMREAGASGYLLKDISASELIDTIIRVHAGEEVYASNLLTRQKDEAGSPAPLASVRMDDFNIGPQQHKVLWLLTKGLTNNEIAEHMNISVPTARYHVSALLQKLDVSNRSEAVALALREGLASDPNT